MEVEWLVVFITDVETVDDDLTELVTDFFTTVEDVSEDILNVVDNIPN